MNPLPQSPNNQINDELNEQFLSSIHNGNIKETFDLYQLFKSKGYSIQFNIAQKENHDNI